VKPEDNDESHRPMIVLPLRTWLTASHLVVLSFPLVAVLGTGALARDLIRQTEDDITHQSALIAIAIEQILGSGDPQTGLEQASVEFSAMFRRVKETTLAGVQLTDHQGVVIASSGDTLGDDLAANPEVQAALSGSGGMVLRPRPVARASSLRGPSRFADVRVFVTQPVSRHGEVIGAVLVSRTPREEIQTLMHMAPRLVWGMGVAILITLLLALNAARAFSRSLGLGSAASRPLAEGQSVDDTDLKPATLSWVAEVAVVGQAVQAMFTRLQARLSYISEFAGNVAHEFRTPLTTLMGTVELLREAEDMHAEQRERFLTNAMTELRRLERLVGGLLKLARAEESAQRTTVTLDKLVEDVARRYPQADPVLGGGQVVADRAQLEAALTNLIDNAVRYGGPTVSVVVQSWVRGRDAGLSVSDDGPGVPPSNQGKIFDRFFTTSRSEGGNGIGLALVKAVTDAHGGEVSLESRPGHTQFRVSLPHRPTGPPSPQAPP